MSTEHSTYDDPNEEHVVNYVPDEISLVVAAGDIDDAAVPRFYEHVRSRLNRQIASLLRARDGEPDSPLENDFAPTVLRQRFLRDSAILQPLNRPKGRNADDVPPLAPWVRLRRRSGSTNHHMYFQIGRGRIRLNRLDREHLDGARQSVRELTLLLNRFVRSTRQEPFGTQAWSIKLAAPNWLTVAHQFACGSPAGLPVPIPSSPQELAFRFDDALLTAMNRDSNGEVIVAVLDTCPQQATVDNAAAEFSENALLCDVQRDVKMNSPALIPTAALDTHLTGCLPRLQWEMLSGPAHDHPEHFAMPDHGLFATGIVYDILQGKSHVHLIRVLNDFGIGDLFALSHALADLPRVMLGSVEPRPGEPRLVVNLSLGIDVPIPERLLDRWLPRTSRHLESLRSRMPDLASLLELLHGNLADIIDALTERGILIVAATGNDALRQDLLSAAVPPPPRFPARYDDVLGVAATRRDLRTAANYSNRGELAVAAWPGDIATFGGNIVPAAAPDQPGSTDPADGVVGILSAKQLPGGAANKSGWARWAGTSFSTPIVGAVAARLWATNTSLGPIDVIAWVRSFAVHPHGGSDPDSPLEVPVLNVSQV